MALEKMDLIKIIGSLDQLDAVIRQCYADGDFHPEQAMQYVANVKGFSPLNQENPYSPPLQKLLGMASVCQYALEKTDISHLELEDDQLAGFVSELEERLGKLQQERQRQVEQIAESKKAISDLQHFTGLNIELDQVFACKFIKVRFGRLPKFSFDKLDSYRSNPYVLFFPCSTDAIGSWGVYFAPLDAAQEVDRIFASLYFERLHIPDAIGTPEEGIAALQETIRQTEGRVEELNHQIAKIWEVELACIQMVYTRLSELSSAFELRRYACKYGTGFYYIGWIPAKSKKAFSRRMDKISGVNYKIEKPEEADKTSPPIRLKNNWLVRPFEFFVEMYGLPTYGEVDPTSFVAITYMLLFGVMFADVGQGLVLSIAGYVMWKFKKMGIGPILIRCGLFSALFGTFFGSVFGFEHALDPLYTKVLGLQEKPFEVMTSQNINTIIFTAIGVGIFLTLFSMCINVYSSIKQKRWGNALFTASGLAGIVFYGSVVYFALNALVFKQSLPAGYVWGLLVFPLVLMFFQEPLSGLVEGRPDWKPESLGDFLMQNLFEMLEYLLSYISNTVSYLRVGAFVLVHAGMMMVVFALASSDNPVMNGIIIVLGNVLVIALEGLLTAIQVLRLEYYEMFSRYFQGEGKKFEPKRI